jgi:HPr kinase/phosphorylase
MEVRTLLDTLRIELGLELIAGRDGLDRRVTGASIQKPGLALAGYAAMMKPGRVQVLGRTEIEYLWSLGPAERDGAVDNLLSHLPPVVVVTRGLDVPDQLRAAADRHNVPLLVTGLRSSLFVEALHKQLANRLARVRAIHGVLVDVFGEGVLIIGKAGIGKSECALELVMRGHRLVADDVVDVSKTPPSTIIGSGNELIRHNMEIRGLGIINIKDLFGVAAIRERKRIDLVVLLEEWTTGGAYDRLGVKPETHDILGVSIPKVLVPVRPGRSLATIIEVAARNQLLKGMGHHSAMEFQERVDGSPGRIDPGRDEHDLTPASLAPTIPGDEVE